jgi:hypothetical protein
MKKKNFKSNLLKIKKYKTKTMTDRKSLKCENTFFLHLRDHDLIDKNYDKIRMDVIKSV